MVRSLVAACVVLFASQSAFAAPRASIRSQTNNKPIRNTSYSSTDTSPSYGVNSSIGARGESKFEMRAGMGKVYGLQPLTTDGDATIFGADMLFKLTRKLYMPFGMSQWKSDLALGDSDYSGEISLLTVDTGIGYNIGLSNKLTMPMGLRAGWYKLEIDIEGEGEYVGQSASFEDQGKHFAPFMGFLYQMSPKVAFGYEMRIPVLVSNNKSDDDDDEESDEDKDDDDDGKSGVPSYQMFMMSVRL